MTMRKIATPVAAWLRIKLAKPITSPAPAMKIAEAFPTVFFHARCKDQGTIARTATVWKEYTSPLRREEEVTTSSKRMAQNFSARFARLGKRKAIPMSMEATSGTPKKRSTALANSRWVNHAKRAIK